MRRALALSEETRAAVRLEAEAEFRERGFNQTSGDTWEGDLSPGIAPSEGAPLILPVRIKLHAEFPDQLPEVFTIRGSLPHPIAHVESSGKVCIAPSSNLLIDVDRPRDLVRDVLARATRVLSDGLAGRNVADVAVEFLAYWEPGGKSVWSIARSEGPARGLASTQLIGAGHPRGDTWIIADTASEAQEWAARAGLTTQGHGPAYLLPLAGAPPLPPSGEVPTLGEWLEKLKAHALPSDWTEFRLWLGGARLPCLLFFSVPAPGSPLRTLAAIELSATSGKAREDAARGFRPGKLPASHELGFARKLPFVRLRIVRLDREYLLARGGGGMEAPTMSLSEKKVALIGCGAVGSHLAQYVAAVGVGTLGLVDDEVLQSPNVQRHALGVEFLGMNKAKALATALGRHFPHQRFAARDMTVEQVLQDEPAFVAEADLVIVALGEPTLERRLNQVLGIRRPRIHAWLEPLGVGGHVVVTGLGTGSGCYECLFEKDDVHGLTNRADLVAPGQHFNRTLAGCAGSFSPFSALDASRTALEAANACGRVLSGEEPENVLVTWRGEIGAFERAGFQLSSRGDHILPGARVRLSDFGRLDCPICGRRAE